MISFDRVVALVAALAAIVAAVYAAAAYRSSDRAALAAKRQRTTDIRPQPVVEHAGYMPSDESSTWTVSVRNVGGAVVQGYLVVQAADWLYGGSIALAAHGSPHLLTLPSRGEPVATRTDPTTMTVRVLLAQDVDRVWWDVVEQSRLAVDWNGADDVRLARWVDDRLLQ